MAHNTDIDTDKSSEILPDDEALNERLRSKGMFTIEQMLDDEASGFGIFDTHIGVKDFDSLAQWVDRKREEYLRMRLKYEIGDKEKDDLYEWVLAHGAAFTCISKHMRKVSATVNPWVPIGDIPDEWKDGRKVDLIVSGQRYADCHYEKIFGWHIGTKIENGNNLDCHVFHASHAMLPPEPPK